jgi:hypothetical protein
MVNSWSTEMLTIFRKVTANRLSGVKELTPVMRSEVEMKALVTT